MSRRELAVALGLVLLAGALYAPVVGFDFVRLDDTEYVTGNPHVATGLSLANLRWALLAFHSSNWHPVTWASHQLDVSLFGLAPGGHHATNVLLFAATAVLLLRFLHVATGRLLPSAVVGLTFVVHPLRVQSVAWVSERKDVLAGLLFFATMLAWTRYARAASAGGGAARRRYALALLLGALGLAAKPSLVVLPFLLFVVDLWPLGRRAGAGAVPWRRLLLEKVPFLLLALLTGLLTVAAQTASGALSPLSEIPLAARLSNAATGLGLYAWKGLVPTALACFHPHPALVQPDWSPWNASAALGILFALGWLALGIAQRGRRPAVLFGFAWYVLFLAPSLGVVQVGDQSWAERYAYLSLLGPALTLAFLLPERPARPARAALALGAALLLLWTALASRELQHWRDSRTLFERALVTTERNHTAEAGLGALAVDEGRLEEARLHLLRALELRPDDPRTLFNLGLLEQKAGSPARAIARYREALALAPASVEALLNLGAALGELGRLEEALETFAEVLAIDPDQPLARANLEQARGQIRALLAAPETPPGDRAELRRLLGKIDRALAPDAP